MPDLETLLQAANAQPLSLDVLRECVEAIAAAVERKVSLEGREPVVTFRNRKGAYYNVRVDQGQYRIVYQHAVAQLEFTLDHTEELAWRICAYNHARRNEGSQKARPARRIFGQNSSEKVFRGQQEGSEVNDKYPSM